MAAHFTMRDRMLVAAQLRAGIPGISAYDAVLEADELLAKLADVPPPACVDVVPLARRLTSAEIVEQRKVAEEEWRKKVLAVVERGREYSRVEIVALTGGRRNPALRAISDLLKSGQLIAPKNGCIALPPPAKATIEAVR